MQIAYIISAYKNPAQLVRLVRRLNHPGHCFLIHVDLNTPAEVYQEMRAPLSGISNAYFLERHACYWGDFGHVQATLKGIAELYRRAIAFDYAILLTGQDYPLRTNHIIAEFLGASEDKSFLHYYRLPNPALRNDRGGLDRIERWHFRPLGRPLAFPAPAAFQSRLVTRLWWAAIKLFPVRRQFPPGLQAYGGSGYWCLSRPSIDYIHDFVGNRPEYSQFFRHVQIPDEIFFQTILLNSPLAGTIVNDDLRYARWPSGDSPSPAILGEQDLPELLAVRPAVLFARKFDTSVDSRILDLIDAQLLSK
jgi:hypothetical protein